MGKSNLAILGGEPVVKSKVWPEWPYVDDKMISGIPGKQYV
jgi:hypothetical protein